MLSALDVIKLCCWNLTGLDDPGKIEFCFPFWTKFIRVAGSGQKCTVCEALNFHSEIKENA